MLGETGPRRAAQNTLLVLRECEVWSSARRMPVPWSNHQQCPALSVDVVTVTDHYELRDQCAMRSRRTLRTDSVVQNDVEQRLVNPDATVIFNKAELAKAIHEEADAGPGGSDHFCQSFLRDLWNQ
jgi:hypothetical protein